MKNAHSHYILFLFYFLLLTSCNTSEIFSVKLNPTENRSNANEYYSLYFTNPNNVALYGYEGGPDEYLASAINNARLTIDVAAYDFNLWSLRDTLIRASKRGVVVRMVMESDNMDNAEVQDLRTANIRVIGDQQEGLMHDKFMVIDRDEVWTGSMNFTVGGAYRDNNNLVNIRSKWLAEMYTAEFEQMFTQRLFEVAKMSPSRLIQTKPDILNIEVLFSPQDNVENRMVEIINDAHSSVDIMFYSFTLDAIGAALIEKYQGGVDIHGVMDQDQTNSNQGTEFYRLIEAGIDIRLDGNEGLMHNKVMIIDKSIVITGSYNFSYNAERKNDENVLIIHDAELASMYIDEFERIYNQAIP